MEIKDKKEALLSRIECRSTEELKKKTFHPGTHVYFKRYYIANHVQDYFYRSYNVLGGQVDVPEGYQVLSLQQVIGTSNDTNVKTHGVDVWFINVKRVEVEPVHNEYLGIYDYSEPGTVVETKVEEKGPELLLRPNIKEGYNE